MKTPVYPFSPQIAVRICQRHLRTEERAARRSAILRRLTAPIHCILLALRPSAPPAAGPNNPQS
jgi:hypothetical protein